MYRIHIIYKIIENILSIRSNIWNKSSFKLYFFIYIHKNMKLHKDPQYKDIIIDIKMWSEISFI